MLLQCCGGFYRATLCVGEVLAIGRCLSVRPSASLSVTLLYFIEMVQDIVKLFFSSW